MARKSSKRSLASKKSARRAAPVDALLGDIRVLIERSREQVARTVNSTLVELYWSIGKRIHRDVLQEQLAEYGEQIVSSLSTQLTAKYGRGFSRQNLFRMIQFAEVFPDEEIVSSLMRQLSSTQRKLHDAVRLARQRLTHEGIAKAGRASRKGAKAQREEVNGGTTSCRH